MSFTQDKELKFLSKRAAHLQDMINLLYESGSSSYLAEKEIVESELNQRILSIYFNRFVRVDGSLLCPVDMPDCSVEVAAAKGTIVGPSAGYSIKELDVLSYYPDACSEDILADAFRSYGKVAICHCIMYKRKTLEHPDTQRNVFAPIASSRLRVLSPREHFKLSTKRALLEICGEDEDSFIYDLYRDLKTGQDPIQALRSVAKTFEKICYGRSTSQRMALLEALKDEVAKIDKLENCALAITAPVMTLTVENSKTVPRILREGPVIFRVKGVSIYSGVRLSSDPTAFVNDPNSNILCLTATPRIKSRDSSIIVGIPLNHLDPYSTVVEC